MGAVNYKQLTRNINYRPLGLIRKLEDTKTWYRNYGNLSLSDLNKFLWSIGQKEQDVTMGVVGH